MFTGKFTRPLLIGATLALLVFASERLGWLEPLELKALDFWFQRRGPREPELPILLVSIDQDSFDELDLPWPWPRTLHAELIRKLNAGRPRVIALDILFTEPKSDVSEDRALAQAIAEAGNVILAAEFTQVASAFGPRQSMNLPTPMIREGTLAYAPVNLTIDRDGIVRRARAGFDFQERVTPTFGYEIHRAALGLDLRANERIPVAPQIINYRGPSRTYPIVPYYRIVRDEIDPSLFENKIVIVGAFAPSLHDVFPTPFGASRPTAGVEIQANFVETLVSGNAIKPLSQAAGDALLFFLSAAAPFAAYRLKPLTGFAAILAILAGYAFGVYYGFATYDLWIPVVAPLGATVLIYGGVTLDNYVREQRERLRLRATFSKYVSADVVEEILEEREGLALGGKRRHITVLFSDIRGFTTISEQIAPELVVSLLSEYLAQAAQIIFKHKGTVDKFIGDAVFAIFGAPKSYGDDALRAVRTGIEMIRLAESLAPKWEQAIGRPLKIGVGVHTGEAVVGAIGSDVRSDFTAIGDTVNLGSRLEALTKELGVPMLVSDATAEETGEAIPLKPVRQVKVTGKESALLVYCPVTLLVDGSPADTETAVPYVQQHK
jgi:adenylate cyclase